MNNVFSLTRFGLLSRRHFSQYIRTYMVSALVFAGLGALLFILLISSGNETVPAGTQYAVYLITIYSGLFIFTSSVFQPFQRPREATFNLMLPASIVEKYLLAWLLSLVFYSICAHGVFFAVRFFIVQYYAAQGYAVGSMWTYDRLYAQPDGYLLFYILGLAYLFVHATALLGSAMFRKRPALLSALALLVFIVLYWYFNTSMVRALLSSDVEQASIVPFMPTYVKADEVVYTVSIGNWLYWVFGFCMLLIGLLWFAAYLKLKEKEI